MLSIVLSRRDFRENDQIISLYTAEKGKLEVLARGVKKINSKNAAYLEPCFLVDAEIILGKEIMYLTKVQPINIFKNIRTDLSKISVAGYAVDLLNKLLQTGETDKNIFLLVRNVLEFLDRSTDIHPIVLDAFVIKLFKLLGFDMACDEKIRDDLKEQVEVLSEGVWPTNNGGLDLKIYQRLHKAVYDFAVFHSERKLAYFGKFW